LLLAEGTDVEKADVLQASILSWSVIAEYIHVKASLLVGSLQEAR